MRVIVTRPEPSATKTAGRLLALGYRVDRLPLFRAIHLEQTVRDCLRAPVGGLIATSAETARALALVPDVLAPHLDKPVFVVGAATARSLAALGFGNLRVAEGNGAALGDLIRTEWTDPRPLVYLAGAPRSPHLEAALDAALIAHATHVVYRMEPIPYSPEAIRVMFADDKAETAVLLYSGEAALRFSDLLLGADADRRTIRIFCLSEAIRDTLPATLRAKSSSADEANEEALLALLARDQG